MVESSCSAEMEKQLDVKGAHYGAQQQELRGKLPQQNLKAQAKLTKLDSVPCSVPSRLLPSGPNIRRCQPTSATKILGILGTRHDSHTVYVPRQVSFDHKRWGG